MVLENREGGGGSSSIGIGDADTIGGNVVGCCGEFFVGEGGGNCCCAVVVVAGDEGC